MAARWCWWHGRQREPDARQAAEQRRVGYNYSNGVSGSGVATYWDSIIVTPEPAALALLGLGGLLFRRRRA